MELRNLSEEVNDVPFIDLAIKCKDKTFQAHRILVCRKSKVLKAALVGGFVEAKTHELNLEEEDPKTVERMLMFCYVDDYDDTPSPKQSGEGLSKELDKIYDPLINPEYTPITFELKINASVYAIAEKYDMPTLKSLAISKFKAVLNPRDVPPGFAQVARDIFTSTPCTDRGLRDVVFEKLTAHIDTVMSSKDFRDLFEQEAKLCYDVLKFVWESHDSSRRHLRRIIDCRDEHIEELAEALELAKEQRKSSSGEWNGFGSFGRSP